MLFAILFIKLFIDQKKVRRKSETQNKQTKIIRIKEMNSFNWSTNQDDFNQKYEKKNVCLSFVWILARAAFNGMLQNQNFSWRSSSILCYLSIIWSSQSNIILYCFFVRFLFSDDRSRKNLSRFINLIFWNERNNLLRNQKLATNDGLLCVEHFKDSIIIFLNWKLASTHVWSFKWLF